VLESGALGKLHHVRAEAYGPVVLRPKGATWRAAKSEGGGALYDYACHAIDLMNFLAGAPMRWAARRSTACSRATWRTRSTARSTTRAAPPASSR
jgi:predicted dehydrogenase